MTEFLIGFFGANWVEISATVFGFICVWLTVKQNIWCWPTGLAQVVLYISVFYTAKLYSDLILHVIYVFMQFYGWYFWLHGGKDRKEAPVEKTPVLFNWVGIAILGIFFWGMTMDKFTDAAVPYWDAFTTVASLVATYLMAKKILESWLFWISVDVVAIGVYFYKGLYPTTILYVCFLVLATKGYFAWKKSYKEDQDEKADAVTAPVGT